MEFTADQKQNLVDMIEGYTKDSLGPLVKDIVANALAEHVPDSGSKDVAEAIQALALSNQRDPEAPKKGETATRIIQALASAHKVKEEPVSQGDWATRRIACFEFKGLR